ncbi:DUF3365 domain-containing protein [bacterium]|nr:MAG: DUF3365 domain-containing protein [bacterium]
MKLNGSVLVLSLFTIAFCGKQKPETNPQKPLSLTIADSITIIAQKTLGGTLMKQIADGGAMVALDFCNHQAIPITDSVANFYQVNIQRIAEKNRNPKNGFSSELDKEVWESYLTGKETGMVKKIDPNGNTIFYKPIRIGMETCLNCHGDANQIKPDVLTKLTELYPNDKATGFKMNDLRGLWKITNLKP